MRIEQIGRIRETIKRGVNWLDGRTPKEEKRVLRIISDPQSISPEDVKTYQAERLGLAATFENSLPITEGIATISINPDLVWQELERQKDLTPKQITDEVIGNARQKAEQWKLKSAA